MAVDISAIRYKIQQRNPMELALCLFWDIPNKFSSPWVEQMTPAVQEWLEVQRHKYGVVAGWLFHWNLGVPLAQELLEPENIPYQADAQVAQKALEMCRALHPRSQKYQGQFPGNDGWLRLWCLSMYSDFLAAVADAGVGWALGIENYPRSLGSGKTEVYAHSRAALKNLEAGRGRPKKTEKRALPSEATRFHELICEAHKIAKRNKAFREGEYQSFINAKVAADAQGDATDLLQVGLIDFKGDLVTSSKGFQIKASVAGTRKKRQRGGQKIRH